MTKRIHAILNNLRGYDSNHVMQESGMFGEKNDIPNDLEEYI